MPVKICKRALSESYLILISKPNHYDHMGGYVWLYNYDFLNKGEELDVEVYINAHHREYKIFLSMSNLQDVLFSSDSTIDMLLNCLSILEGKYIENKNKHFKNRHFKDAKESLNSAIEEIIFSL